MLETAMAAYHADGDGAAFVNAFAACPADRLRAVDVLVLPVFLAHLLDAAPDAARALVAAGADAGGAAKVEIVAQALNYCHLPDREAWMERLAGPTARAAMDGGGAGFKALVPSHPVHVDMWRVSFLATGDGEYLDLVAGLLDGWMAAAPLAELVGRAGQDSTAQPAAMAGLLAQAAEATLSGLGGDPAVADCLQRRAARADGVGAAVAARLAARLQAGVSSVASLP